MSFRSSALWYDDPLVASPTATQRYLRCPTLFLASHAAPTDLMVTGRMVAQVLATLHPSRAVSGKTPAVLARALAMSPALYDTCVRASEMVMRHGVTVAAELRLGKCRIDHVVYGEDSISCIVDYKYIPSLTEENASSLTEQYHVDHQLHHYAWAYAQYCGLWFKPSFTINIAICLLTDIPQPYVAFRSFSISKEQIQAWLDNTIIIWYNITKVKQEKTTYKNTEACWNHKYGQCLNYSTCHQDRLYQLQPSAQQQDTISHSWPS